VKAQAINSIFEIYFLYNKENSQFLFGNFIEIPTNWMKNIPIKTSFNKLNDTEKRFCIHLGANRIVSSSIIAF